MPRLCALLLFLAPLAAAAQPVASPKSERTATTLSLVAPGGGQLYSGETVKGGLLLVGALGGLAVAANELPALAEDVPDRGYYTTHGTRFGLGLGVAGVLWLYGIVDAPSAARRANQRNGLASVELAPALIVAEGQHRAGVQLRASF
ncbi:MAG: hypothetical protein Rubg2KO_00230 [Rubricoccaceae bacterium]